MSSYDIKNDKWLLDKINDSIGFSNESRVMLITDDILIWSEQSCLSFYFIGKTILKSLNVDNQNINNDDNNDNNDSDNIDNIDHITDPLYLGKCFIGRIGTPMKLEQHGLVCTQLKIIKNGINMKNKDGIAIDNDKHNIFDDKKYDIKLQFQLFIFGQNEYNGCLPMFWKCDVILCYNPCIDDIRKLVVQQSLVNFDYIDAQLNYDTQQEKLNSNLNSTDYNCNTNVNVKDEMDNPVVPLSMFGYICVRNAKQEPIIITIDGMGKILNDKDCWYKDMQSSSSVWLFNTVTKKATYKKDVKCISTMHFVHKL